MLLHAEWRAPCCWRLVCETSLVSKKGTRDMEEHTQSKNGLYGVEVVLCPITLISWLGLDVLQKTRHPMNLGWRWLSWESVFLRQGGLSKFWPSMSLDSPDPFTQSRHEPSWIATIADSKNRALADMSVQAGHVFERILTLPFWGNFCKSSEAARLPRQRGWPLGPESGEVQGTSESLELGKPLDCS